MDVASALNEDVVTDFPVLDAVGKLEPGILRDHGAPVERRAEPRRRERRRERTACRAMDGDLRHRSDRDFRRRRGARDRAVAGLPPRRSQASK